MRQFKIYNIDTAINLINAQLDWEYNEKNRMG